MTGKECYRIWAPGGKSWTDWVRPVPFVAIRSDRSIESCAAYRVRQIDYIHKGCTDTAVIVDLPGAESVAEGISLTRCGFRPIPVFNGTMEQEGARATVDNRAVAEALVWGAERLREYEPEDTAPPAFLLDSNRLHRFKPEIALFDNSWDIYPQDLPSAELLLRKGISKILIVGKKNSADLRKVLYPFQKRGISILRTDGYETPVSLRLPRPLRREKD